MSNDAEDRDSSVEGGREPSPSLVDAGWEEGGDAAPAGSIGSGKTLPMGSVRPPPTTIDPEAVNRAAAEVADGASADGDVKGAGPDAASPGDESGAKASKGSVDAKQKKAPGAGGTTLIDGSPPSIDEVDEVADEASTEAELLEVENAEAEEIAPESDDDLDDETRSTLVSAEKRPGKPPPVSRGKKPPVPKRAAAPKPPPPKPSPSRPGKTRPDASVRAVPRDTPSQRERRGKEKPRTSTKEVDVATEIERRAAKLETSDPIQAGWARFERGLLAERSNGDVLAALSHYQAAVRLHPALVGANLRLLRIAEQKGDHKTAHQALDNLIENAADPADRADFLVQAARLDQTLTRHESAAERLRQALELVPDHPGALRHLERLLRRGKAANPEALAAHLVRVADVCLHSRGPDHDPAWASALHADRASILDRQLEQTDPATRALQASVELEPSPGPLRRKLRHHLLRHARHAELVHALEEEAGREAESQRAFRLRYRAARVARDWLDEPATAAASLERAVSTEPPDTLLQPAAFYDLVETYEREGNLPYAVAARARRLETVLDEQQRAHEHARIAAMSAELKEWEGAIEHARRALELDPEDESTRGLLDRAYAELGRHADRRSLLETLAHRHRDLDARVEALVAAARVARGDLGKPEDAVQLLWQAWAIDRGNADVLDELASLLSPMRLDPDSNDPGVAALRARLLLYREAVAAESAPARKIAYLEKIAALWEEDFGLPERAAEVAREILEAEPDRHSALLLLARCAAKTGDDKTVADTTKREAELVSKTDSALASQLCLRAATAAARADSFDQALMLVERAIALSHDPLKALRTKARIAEAAGRHQDAVNALTTVVKTTVDEEERYRAWLRVARIEEIHRKRLDEAIRALEAASKIHPNKPDPEARAAQLLAASGRHKDHANLLMSAAGRLDAPTEKARCLLRAADVMRTRLKDAKGALRTLRQAESVVDADKTSVFLEEAEGVLAEQDDLAGLVELYERWFHQGSHADFSVRFALAEAQAESGDPDAAITTLRALLESQPNDVLSLRRVETLLRQLERHDALYDLLRKQTEVVVNRVVRRGILWEIADAESRVGVAQARESLVRLIQEDETELWAHERMVRLAAKPVDGPMVELATHFEALSRWESPPVSAGYHLELAVYLEATTAGEDPDDASRALAHYLSALELFPESLLAARGALRLSTRIGDEGAARIAHIALGELVDDNAEKATHLRLASELMDAHEQVEAVRKLLERALELDPDSEESAERLIQVGGGEPLRLAEHLDRAFERASRASQRMQLAAALGGLSLDDQLERPRAIRALREAIAQGRPDGPPLMLLARLLIKEGALQEARQSLEAATNLGDERIRVAGNLELARMFAGPLGDPNGAKQSLEQVLSVDPNHPAALELLRQLADQTGDAPMAIDALSRMLGQAGTPTRKLELSLELAELLRRQGDTNQASQVLCEAILAEPKNTRGLDALRELYRPDASEAAAKGFANALTTVLHQAQARGIPHEIPWIAALGLLEATTLRQPEQGVARLTEATKAPNAPAEAFIALARGLATLGRTHEAIATLREAFTSRASFLVQSANLTELLETWESFLATGGRVEERMVVEEVRATLGFLSEERKTWFRERTPQQGSPYADVFAGGELHHVVTPEARGPAIDVRLAFAPMAAKALRFDLGQLNIGTRERVSSRDGHPTRTLADSLARALDVGFELYVVPHAPLPAQVYPGDPPAIVVTDEFTTWRWGEQSFALGRLLALVALGAAWIDLVPSGEEDGLVLAMLRVSDAGFGSGELSHATEDAFERHASAAKKAVGWLQRRKLDDVLRLLSAPQDAFTTAESLRQSANRVAYALSGNLIGALDYLRHCDSIGTNDPAVLLADSVRGPLIRFALSEEGYRLRRQTGATWAT